jgi:hypothetical protein
MSELSFAVKAAWEEIDVLSFSGTGTGTSTVPSLVQLFVRRIKKKMAKV